MDNILDKLNTLKRTAKITDKQELIKEYIEDEDFRIVVELALDGTLHYNTTVLPPRQLGITGQDDTGDFNELIDFLHYLAGNQGANKKDKQDLSNLCINDTWRDIVIRILKKDLKCKVHGRLINKVVPGFVSIMPYMRCSHVKRIDRVRYPAMVQNKEDGVFVNIFRYKTHIKCLSRNGNEYIFPENSIENELLDRLPYDEAQQMVYMGEFRVKYGDDWLPRKTSNGIVNKALKKNQSISLQDSTKVHFICWDAVPMKDFWEGECSTPYTDRFDSIQYLGMSSTDNTIIYKCHLCYTEYVDSEIEAIAFANKQVQIGEEGAVLKDCQSNWANKTHKRIIKLKSGAMGDGKERECELRVVGFYAGKKGSKYEHCLGGLSCESEYGDLETNIGSGLSDEERFFTGFDDEGNIIDPDWDKAYDLIDEKFMHKIITVRFNEMIEDKKGSKPRLFLARYIEIRDDKNDADTVNYIEEL